LPVINMLMLGYYWYSSLFEVPPSVLYSPIIDEIYEDIFRKAFAFK